MRARLAMAIAMALAPTVKAQTVDGWRYATTMTTDSGDGRPHVITMRHIIADGLLRAEVTSNDPRRSEVARGTYSIKNVRDSTFYAVMPSQRMASLISSSPDRVAAVVLPKYVSHASSTQTDLGAGELILGHQTHRYRTTITGTMDATLDGRTCTRSIDGVTEVWIAPDVDPSAMFAAERRINGTPALTVDSAQSQAQTEIVRGTRGFPIRTRSTRTVADSAGHTRTIVTTMEYTELDHGPIDRSLFEIPAGYRVLDLRRFARSNPDGPNEVIRRATAKSLCPNGK